MPVRDPDQVIDQRSVAGHDHQSMSGTGGLLHQAGQCRPIIDVTEDVGMIDEDHGRIGLLDGGDLGPQSTAGPTPGLVRRLDPGAIDHRRTTAGQGTLLR